MLSRRKFLKMGAGAGAGLITSCGETLRSLDKTVPDEGQSLQRFVDTLPIPKTVHGSTGASLEIGMSEFRQQLHRDLDSTLVWGYGGVYPGPTIEVQKNEPIKVRWVNRLSSQHRLQVDPCLHGPHSYRDRHRHPQPRAVVHLHGGHVPPQSDGYPEAVLLPGQAVTYDYPNLQNSSTLWYHDHALGITRLNVYMGMAGMYLIRDPFETRLNLPQGPYEIPLVIQDRSFNKDGSLRYPDEWQEEFFGAAVLVNGKVWPYLDMQPRKYRFRILNGSNSRTYTLAFDSDQPFYQVGTDGGLLEEPIEVSQITLTAGERADVIVDFSKRKGEVHLVNSAPAPFPGPPGQGVIREIMQFRVTGLAGDDSSLPAKLAKVPRFREDAAVNFRRFNLEMVDENPKCTDDGFRWLINRMGWDDITEYPALGTTEVWSFFNLSADVHPIHLHLVQFQILDHQRLLPDANGGNFFLPEAVPGSKPFPPDPNEAGWKDTFRSMPGEVTRIIAKFDSFTGKYPYHCHILEHEDHEMMRQFQVVESKQK